MHPRVYVNVCVRARVSRCACVHACVNNVLKVTFNLLRILKQTNGQQTEGYLQSDAVLHFPFVGSSRKIH